MNQRTADTFLKIQKRYKEVQDRYANSSSIYRNMLVIGDYGTGKTQLFGTCPKPVHIDSFDPGGTKTAALQPLIESGDIVVENKYENDDWKNPWAYDQWVRDMRERIADGYFDYIGTYGLDSTTRWAMSMMYAIMSRGSKVSKPHAGETPQLQDFMLQQFDGADIISHIMALPCHTLITGHIALTKDEVTGKLETGLMLWGKFSNQLPLSFDEKYIMRVEKDKHMLQVKNDGYYKAETRMGGTKFQKYEEPNIQALLKKGNGGVSISSPSYIAWEDKESIEGLMLAQKGGTT